MNQTTVQGKIQSWLPHPADSAMNRALERLARAPGVCRIAVMPDAHLSMDVCVGTVTGTSHTLYPQAVGGDIGCGMTAVRFQCGADLLDDERTAARLLAGLYEVIPSNRHPAKTAPDSLPQPLLQQSLSHPRLEAMKGRDGRVQLGTLGRGNHFLEFQADGEDQLWVMLHSGSRAMGPAIRDHHLNQGIKAPCGLTYLDASSPEGQAYLADASWAGQYAMVNRGAMTRAVAQLMDRLFGVTACWETLLECDHNHLRRETHQGVDLWVHRKGANAAARDQPGLVPGSMGSVSHHTLGKGCHEAMCSSSHGAGRQMSRTQARKTITLKKLEREMEGVWYNHRLGKGLLDEAPSSYKDIRTVMRAQRELTRSVNTLRPLLSYKGV